MNKPLAEMIMNDFLDFKTESNHGFYDWFCKDSSLENKCKNLCSKVKAIAKNTKKFDMQKVYVFFKNNCPCRGPLYDDFRIVDNETGDVKYTVVPKSGHTGHAEVWGEENDFAEALVEGTWSDVEKFFAS